MLAIKYGFSFIVISSECDTRHNHFDSAGQRGLRTRMKIDQLFFSSLLLLLLLLLLLFYFSLKRSAFRHCVFGECFLLCRSCS